MRGGDAEAMIVGIKKNELKVGMYVESVDCPAFEFSRRRFLIRSQKEIDQIQKTAAEHVLINTELGSLPVRHLDRGDQGAHARVVASVQNALRTSVEAVTCAFEAVKSDKSIDTAALDHVVSRLESVAYQAPDVLVSVSRLKVDDEVTFLHSVAVSALMMRVGQVMNLNEGMVADMGLAGLLHDVGKVFIPPEILAKPGVLTPAEKEVIKEHPKSGFDLLVTDGRFPPTVLEVCLSHHELLDGSGYPYGVCGDKLGMPVRIATVCDVFDALTTVRPYKDSWSTERALAWLYNNSSKYDARIVGRLSDAIQPKLIC